MQCLDLTLPTAAENVALDEALLDEAESGRGDEELLRLWELPRPAVVIGRSSRAAQEVHLDECQRRGIEVVRRTSGGAAIVAGPGCLMYSLLLSCRLRPELHHIDRTHAFVLGRLAAALAPRVPGVAPRGTSDLAVEDRKFSGNSLRCKRQWLLYHGTILYDFPLPLLAALLATPPRQPDYRGQRGHEAFVTNLPLPRGALTQAIRDAFAASQSTTDWPRQDVERLVRERFGRPAWTLER